jgi:formate hydrogenlyase subunit 3/multisubunit Na+/H+ antiporter MnhD subunit
MYALFYTAYASEFEKNSDKLERMLYWRNMKIKILIALCALGLIGFVVLIIVQSTRKN